MDNTEREKLPLGRFEIIAEKYLYGNNRDREIILSFLEDHEKQVFLNAVGLYHLFTDQNFYNSVRNAVGKRIYDDFHK